MARRHRGIARCLALGTPAADAPAMRKFVLPMLAGLAFSSYAHADIERVLLHDGSVIEGDLVEKIPNDHVTLKLATGEVRRIEWQAIVSSNRASAKAPQTAPAQSVTSLLAPPQLAQLTHVDVTTDSPGPVLMKNAGPDVSTLGAGVVSITNDAGLPVPVCYAPCSADVDPRATYYVTGAYVTRTRNFALPAGSSALSIHAGSSTVRALGGASLAVGITTLVVGAVWLPLSFLNFSCDYDCPPAQPGLNGWQWAGIGILIAGGALSLLSIPFILAGQTHAWVNGIDVARGKVRLTTRGLAF